MTPEQACPTLCDPDCAELCHEVHSVFTKRDHDPEQCRGRLLAEAERRGAEQALREAAQMIKESGAVLIPEWLIARADQIGRGQP